MNRTDQKIRNSYLEEGRTKGPKNNQFLISKSEFKILPKNETNKLSEK